MPETYLESLLHDIPHLLCRIIAGVFDLDIASLVGNRLRRIWAAGVAPSRVVPPVFDAFDLVLKELLFCI